VSYAKCEELSVDRKSQSLGVDPYRKAIGRIPRANSAFPRVFQDTAMKQTTIGEKEKLALDISPRMAPPHAFPEVVRLRKDRWVPAPLKPLLLSVAASHKGSV
jgi:hypothetical protein